MQRTKIEYLTHSWNPIAMRCTPVSVGCQNCWHLETVRRFGLKDEGLREKELVAPLRLKKPARIGIQFMGDLFHESAPFDWIDSVMSVINRCSQHIFQILTKRPDMMLKYFCGWYSKTILPIENLWLGVSVENQEMADKRIPILLQIPAKVRFVSVEPMLGPVDMRQGIYYMPGNNQRGTTLDGIDWVIIGCESGPKRREFNNMWAINLVKQCESAGVACFVKQLMDPDRKVIKNPKGWPQEYPK